MKLPTSVAAAALLLAMSGAVRAELLPRAGGMVYDSTLDITWLADMDYARTSGYDADGLMIWDDARRWADGLVFGGYDDWRLPRLNASDTTCSTFDDVPGFGPQYHGQNCTGGELSHLFVADFGNKAGESVFEQAGDTAQQIANLALFSNVPHGGIWSGTAYAPDTDYAWLFFEVTGSQFHLPRTFAALRPVAVRPGDVMAVVPEPEGWALLLAGLSVVGGIAQRRRG